jgi:hypothetical protein
MMLDDHVNEIIEHHTSNLAADIDAYEFAAGVVVELASILTRKQYADAGSAALIEFIASRARLRISGDMRSARRMLREPVDASDPGQFGERYRVRAARYGEYVLIRNSTRAQLVISADRAEANATTYAERATFLRTVAGKLPDDDSVVKDHLDDDQIVSIAKQCFTDKGDNE